MRRREFITLLGGAVVTWPLAANAQQSVRRIGVLMPYPESDAEAQSWIAAFREDFAKLGWAEARNVRLDIRWGANAALIQQFARELVGLQPDLILTSGTPATAALLRETRTIPIVFAIVADPIGSGFVASFPRPGGNVTGFTNIESTMAGKWLELLKEVAPRVDRVALLFNPVTTPLEYFLTPFKAAAPLLGMQPIAAPVRDTPELEAAVAELARAPNGGLIVMPDSFMAAHRVEITSLAARYRLPAVYSNRQFAQAGGLLSFGNDISDNYRRAAGYVDRVLKGEKPSELPAQFPVKFELTINLKTAATLGLAVPLFLQQRADEVIE